jgi:hypothetical protein
MYTDEQIEELFKNKYNLFDPQCKQYLDAYINIYKQSFINPCQSDKYNFHHFFPSFIYKQIIGEKNRYHTIEKLDEMYKPNDNVCKLRILYHILAHYYLAMALKGTMYEFDANNVFFTLIGDYSRKIETYTFDEVKEIGRLIEENALPNQIDHYVTQSERKELCKQSVKENKEKYMEEHKDEIEQKKLEFKQKQKEYKKQWEERHKEEIEERKRKQKEYIKNIKKFKKY